MKNCEDYNYVGGSCMSTSQCKDTETKEIVESQKSITSTAKTGDRFLKLKLFFSLKKKLTARKDNADFLI